MSIEVVISLKTLNCFAEDDGIGASEPYIWAFAIVVIQGIPNIYKQSLNHARVLIKDGIRPNQSAAIPTEVGIIKFNLNVQVSEIDKIILVVTLMEEDSSKEIAMQKGVDAYGNILANQLILNAQSLTTTNDSGNREEFNLIIKEITNTVSEKVIEAVLSEETRFKDHDDSIATDFLMFSKQQNAADRLFAIQSQDFILSFVSEPVAIFNNPGFPSATRVNNFGLNSPQIIIQDNYQIDGSLEIRLPKIDLCKMQVLAVNNAKSSIESVDREIKSLQDNLKGASPTEKSRIIQEISEVRSEQLAEAQATLKTAEKALQDCRSRINDLQGTVGENNLGFSG
jgi:hypothetical protein